MKRIPRQFPAARTQRARGAARSQAAAETWTDACVDAHAQLSPRAVALLERLRAERDLRLERGLISEASGIDLAIRLVCEAAQPAGTASCELIG
jgi:hypothetical protein